MTEDTKVNKEDEEFFAGLTEATGNWFKFAVVGDKIKGVLTGKREQKGTGDFPDQMVYELRLPDNSFVNVGISVKKTFVIERLRHATFGQTVAFVFTEEIPAKTKGYAACKSIKVYLGEQVDPETVKVGEDEDPFGE